MSSQVPEVGARIRSARQQRRLSLSEVAGRMGLSVATLSRIETSKQSLDVDLLVALSRVLGVPASRLLGDTDGDHDLEVLADRLAALSAGDRARLLQAAMGRRDSDLAAVIGDLLSTLDVMRDALEKAAREPRKRAGRRRVATAGDGDHRR